ncbi:MAG: hypothetical protein Kow0060_08720 [Methylohalobius crimeensis]
MRNYRLLLLLAALLGGCSWLIPDREKQYLQARQLPPLKLPADTGSADRGIQPPPPAVPAQTPPPLPTVPNSTAPYIELAQPFTEAWVSTLKALNRLRLEITERDPDRGRIGIVYTPAEEELAEPGGWWEDILYFFTGAGTLREENYQLLLQPSDDTTRLYLLDSEGKPRTDPLTMDLLERLKQTLATLPQS